MDKPYIAYTHVKPLKIKGFQNYIKNKKYKNTYFIPIFKYKKDLKKSVTIYTKQPKPLKIKG